MSNKIKFNLISLVKSSLFFSAIRKIKYRYKRKELSKQEQLSLEAMRFILTNDLKIKEGDSVFVHCGFGFLNAKFTPLELVELLKSIVGRNGNIMMPFYPPGLSSNWAKSGRVFDSAKVRCSTGILAQKFSKAKTVISLHPTKAVAAWGNKASVLVADHEKSIYPYGKATPYYKFSCLPNSKSIGLGVTNCAMIHCAEDVYEKNKSYLYTKEPVSLKVKSSAGNVDVDTFIHHGKIKLCTSSEFLSQHSDQSKNYKVINNVPFYSIDNHDLLKTCKKLFELGINRKCL